jgi:hypothetical protein
MHAADHPRTSLAPAWPHFGLRVRSERLVLRLPTDDDLLALMDVPSSVAPLGGGRPIEQ